MSQMFCPKKDTEEEDLRGEDEQEGSLFRPNQFHVGYCSSHSWLNLVSSVIFGKLLSLLVTMQGILIHRVGHPSTAETFPKCHFNKNKRAQKKWMVSCQFSSL